MAAQGWRRGEKIIACKIFISKVGCFIMQTKVNAKTKSDWKN
jgi:hypothetical protein